MDEDEIRRAEERGKTHRAIEDLERRVSGQETKIWAALVALLGLLAQPILEIIKSVGGPK